MKFTSVLFGLVLVAFLAQALGHSYMTKPVSRSNQAETQTGCRGPNCVGPCDRPRSAATRPPIVIQRGASISVEWPRNNHAGGFIRLAWAPTSQSDSHTAFDAGVQQVSCHEVGGCGPDRASDPNGGDSGPSDGSSRACKVTIQVPTWLTNGAWTLQWAWYGGAFQLGDYYSCTDYTITGGPSSAQTPALFKGGDFTYPGQQKCKFFNTDRLRRCVNEPCDNPVYPAGERSGAPFGISASPVPPVDPIPNPVRITTGAVATPVPSGRVTTGVASTPSPTASPTPSPTASPTPSPTASPTPSPVSPSPAPPSGPCTLGQQRCNQNNTFQTCVYTSNVAVGWSVSQSCSPGTNCVSSQNYIYCA